MLWSVMMLMFKLIYKSEYLYDVHLSSKAIPYIIIESKSFSTDYAYCDDLGNLDKVDLRNF